MEGNVVARDDLTEFKNCLRNEERSVKTIDKYCRDVATFMGYAGASQCVTREVVIGYKRHLREACKVTNASSILATLNYFFHFKGRNDCRVGLFKVQGQLMGSEGRKLTKEECKRPIKAAWSNENKRSTIIMETIGNIRIRVSELSFITVESLYTGQVEMYNKGKYRTIFIIEELRRLLLEYYREQNLSPDPVFMISGGVQMNRSNVWSEMKKLCTRAGIPRQKVFPHNLRHLFAYAYCGVDKDLVHLADILGHSNVETTRIYTVFTGEEQEAVMKKTKTIVWWIKRHNTYYVIFFIAS